MKIYAIKDIKANTYNTPFFQRSDVHATRAFNAECNRQDPANMMYLYPEDFALYYMGEFNEDNGNIQSTIVLLQTGKKQKQD